MYIPTVLYFILFLISKTFSCSLNVIVYTQSLVNAVYSHLSEKEVC